MIKFVYWEKGRRGGINFDQSRENYRQFLFFIFIFFIFFYFLILCFRLFQLTIIRGNYYRRLSDENRIKKAVVEAKRGKILDRKGYVLAQNTDPEIKSTADRIISRRVYQSPETIGQIIGYRQLADKKDLENDSCLNKAKLGDKVGKKGIEKIYECDLRGRAGEKLIEVDARGNTSKNKTLAVNPAKEGLSIQLALDFELQEKAQKLLMGKKGAIVALKPQTGEILSLFSSPSFNPQAFEDNQQPIINQYLTDRQKPLFNRASEGVYPPGSIFKLIVAVSALEENKIDEKSVFEDTGTIMAGPLSFGNWYFLQYGKTEGMVDIIKAIRRSNDIFFYKTGALLGPEKIKSWAEKFGFGDYVHSGLKEATGIIPSPFWKKETLGENWYLGDTYNFSIGQGYLLTTPLQAAILTGVFANGGYLCQPQLLKNGPPNCQKLPISSKTLDLIRQGMKQACSPGGTGWPLFGFSVISDQLTDKNQLTTSHQPPITNQQQQPPTTNHQSPTTNIQVACKTGTAESHAKSGLPHAWFTVFAPFENPQITLTILVEEGGQGSDIAGPLAKELLKTFFERSQ